jgi:hypothetical protein
MREIKPGKIYKHFKGNLYYILDIVLDCETEDINNPKKVVIYKALYGDNLTWARSYESFISEVDHKKYPNIKQKYRFEEYIIE